MAIVPDNGPAYANSLKYYERQLELVNEQLDREWLAYISGRCAIRRRHKTVCRLQYLEGIIARIKYVHIPAIEESTADERGGCGRPASGRVATYCTTNRSVLQWPRRKRS